jgi:predicted lipid carrier protein YhbT
MITPKVIKALPSFGQKLNQWLPVQLKICLIDKVVNQLFLTDSQSGELDFLVGKIVVIEVTDFAFLFSLTLQEREVRVAPCNEVQNQQADLRVKASSEDFFLLCSNKADPDTLFFQRRLSMLGDTELGLYLKNFLDSYDTAARLPEAVWLLQQWLATQLLACKFHP